MEKAVRKPLIAGNWKMHGTLPQIKTLVEAIKQGSKPYTNIDILLLPTFVHLPVVHTLLANSSLLLGAQDLYPGEQGAFTGEVSGAMLKEIGCEYVLIGHSERRTLFREDLMLVAAKFKAAVEAGLRPILCVGETEKEREKGETSYILHKQIQSVIDMAGIELFRHAVIAYEPVWAIGTGLTATPAMAEEAHGFIRQIIMQNNVDIAKTICILYGGSMKAENAASLLAMPNIDGGLIGGASLQAESFLKICADASQKVELTRAANS
jgi:triosephosphate isomerase (TIM)